MTMDSGRSQTKMQRGNKSEVRGRHDWNDDEISILLKPWRTADGQSKPLGFRPGVPLKGKRYAKDVLGSLHGLRGW
jgi:hypothetical protein